MKHLLALAALALATAGAAGQQTKPAPEPCPCAPFENSPEYYALVLSYNLVGGPGPWLVWSCYPQRIPAGSTTAPPPKRCALVDRWQNVTLAKLGDRAETVRKASDPVAAFRASWKRHVAVPMSDPQFDEVRAAMAADLKAKGK